MNEIPSFLTHYYESEYGPFRNICDLPESDWEAIIEREKNASTEFNRYSMGKEFFKNRCEAEDHLIQLYASKFGRSPKRRPSYAILGSFDRTGKMYRHPRKIELPLSVFEENEVTFIYEDHSHLGWTMGSQPKPVWFKEREYHTMIFSKSDLGTAFASYGWHEWIQSARSQGCWVSSYVEAHIWISLEELKRRSQVMGGFESFALPPTVE